jgi:anaerobic C4-dicarboxylate transporter
MTQQNSQDIPETSFDFNEELSKNLTIHKNVKQEIIISTADKIKLVLISTKQVLTSQRDWWTPFGLLISFITTLLTSEFKETIGLSKDFWQAIFVLLSIFSFIWLIKTLIKLIKNWDKDNVDTIIEQIKLKPQDESTDS